MTANDVKRELDRNENPKDAEFLQRFFKTRPGEYGAGDVFIGVRVPTTRRICKLFEDLPLIEIEKLLDSPIHEHRLAAVIIMAEQAKHAPEKYKQKLYELYLKRTDRINNWDIVDVSCRDVVGGYLIDKDRNALYKLARSNNIWERRIAIVSTWQFIRKGDLADTFKIAQILGNDKHDLIQKAVGWMLREAGKKDEVKLKKFLDVHSKEMPRTMLRYSIERLSASNKAHYMSRS